jgi:hypothetical protein
MTSTKFERLEGLTSISAMKQFEQAIRIITSGLLAEGFDDNDIKEYLECVVGFVVDETADPL